MYCQTQNLNPRWRCIHIHLTLTVFVIFYICPPPPFRPSEPALCGICPLVTPYYCGLVDLLCLFCVVSFLSRLLSVHMCFLSSSLFDLYFVASPSVLWYCWLGLLTCKNRLPYNLYCVGGDVKHCYSLSTIVYGTDSRMEETHVVLVGLRHCRIAALNFASRLCCRPTGYLRYYSLP